MSARYSYLVRFLLATLIAPPSWVMAVSSIPISEGVAYGSPPTEAGLEAEFSRARETLRDSPEYRRGDAASHYRLGKKLHHAGDLTGATEEFGAAIRLDPDLADAHRQLGVVLLDRHDFAGAAEAFRETLRLQAGDAQTLYWLGRALMGQGDWAGASEVLGRAAALNPEDPEALADLGLVLMVQGHLRAAGEALRNAIRLNPNHANAHHLLDQLREFRDDPQEASRAARQILSTLFERE